MTTRGANVWAEKVLVGTRLLIARSLREKRQDVGRREGNANFKNVKEVYVQKTRLLTAFK